MWQCTRCSKPFGPGELVTRIEKFQYNADHDCLEVLEEPTPPIVLCSTCPKVASQEGG